MYTIAVQGSQLKLTYKPSMHNKERLSSSDAENIFFMIYNHKNGQSTEEEKIELYVYVIYYSIK
jgi:hypothetical protein